MDDMLDNKLVNKFLLIPVTLLNPSSRVGFRKRRRTPRAGCHIVYPFVWNGQGTEAPVCPGLLNMEYEVAPAGWEI